MRYNRVRAVIGLVVSVIITSLCPLARASIEPRGDPILGGSWGQCFSYNDPRDGTIDLVAVKVLSGSTLESPTFRKFNVPNWDILLETPTDSPELAAAGTYTNPVPALSFQVWFDAEPTDPVSLLFSAWRPGESLAFEAFELTWDGGGQRAMWVVEPSPVRPPRPIPAPGAVALGVLGLSLTGWLKRRVM